MVTNSFISPESSTVERADYDPQTRTMVVTFKHKGRYRYSSITQEKWERFYNASSKGSHFNQEIRAAHAGTRI